MIYSDVLQYYGQEEYCSKCHSTYLIAVI